MAEVGEREAAARRPSCGNCGDTGYVPVGGGEVLCSVCSPNTTNKRAGAYGRNDG